MRPAPANALAAPPVAPALDTARLTLRAHTAADLDDCAALWADPTVVRHIGGRPFTAEETWARVLRYAGLWALVGFGYWVARDRSSGRFVGELGLADFRRAFDPPLAASLARIPHERDPLHRMLYLEAKHFLADHNLNYTDKTGMAAGVEVRVPLLDQELVDFAVRVPSGMKQRGGTGKAIFKRAMEPDLPRDVIYRPKTGFGAPLRRWLHHELRDRVADALSDTSLRSRGLFDPGAVRRLVAADAAGHVDGAYTIFALVCLELWCRMFVDPPVPQAYA